jgi:benzoyl-CoA reductase/2-hydroxyglutaryl-CoA dehydratase subunit BcrC/BadD/HgdB
MTSKAMTRLHLLRDERCEMLNQAKQIPVKEVELQMPLFNALVEDIERTIRCVERGENLLVSWYCNGPEIYAAMDLHWYSLTSPISAANLLKDLEQADQLALPRDVCSLHRMMLRAIEAGDTPVPSAVVALLTPCDGISLVHDALVQQKDWRNVPIFGLDPPYWEDERAIVYHAGELRRMVSFLEEHTGRKLDIDRLREVIGESNNQYRLWIEYDELKRCVPCPHPSFSATGMYMVAQSLPPTVGHPDGTDYFKGFVADAEERVKAGEGAVENEKIRIFWADLAPIPPMNIELRMWLQAEWGANIIMDSMSFCQYEIIDTSSEDSMFQGLAKRDLYHTPMIRQARGPVDTFLDDVVRMVRDFKVNCVILPGHMGHKDMSAAVGLIRELCRDIRVPFLHIGMDLWDPRYTPMEEIKDKMAKFFMAMEMG